MTTRIGTIAAVAFLCAAGAAEAQTYTFNVGQDVISASPGEVLSVPLFLSETIDPSVETTALTNDVGVFSAELSATDGLGGGMTIGFTGDSAFELAPDATPVAGVLEISVSQLVADPVLPMLTMDGALEVRRVRLGTIDLIAGDSNTTFSLSDNVGFTTLADPSLTTLLISGADFTVTPTSFVVAVPEPSTAVALTAAGGLVLLRRRRA